MQFVLDNFWTSSPLTSMGKNVLVNGVVSFAFADIAINEVELIRAVFIVYSAFRSSMFCKTHGFGRYFYLVLLGDWQNS